MGCMMGVPGDTDTSYIEEKGAYLWGIRSLMGDLNHFAKASFQDFDAPGDTYPFWWSTSPSNATLANLATYRFCVAWVEELRRTSPHHLIDFWHYGGPVLQITELW